MNNLNEQIDVTDLLPGDTTTTTVTEPTTVEPSKFRWPSPLDLPVGFEVAKEKTQEFLSNPNNLAAIGAGALTLGGLDMIRRSNKRDDRGRSPGFLKRVAGTGLGLGLTGAGAYAASQLMKPKLSEAQVNPYSSAFKPSSILGGTLGTAAAIGSFPLADVITSGMKEGPLKTITNIGAKALLSTVGTAGAGYAGFKAGEEIEKAQKRAEEKKRQEQNPYLPKFYNYDFA